MRLCQIEALRRIDAAIDHLYKKRLVHFQRTSQKYYTILRTKYLGFEAMVSAELYSALQAQFDDFSVFMEFPGLHSDRIDTFVDKDEKGITLRGYIELKMYYGSTPQAYKDDFIKLTEMINADNDAVAVQIHFELYQNANQPNHKTMGCLATSLDTSYYWNDTRLIGDPEFHFCRLAFGVR